MTTLLQNSPMAPDISPLSGPQDFVVTTIGTCRIAEPVEAASKLLPMQRNVDGIYGFVHTTKEILQQIDRFEGREIAPELVRFIASADYTPFSERSDVDIFFVEVSSQKEIHFRDNLLQINCLDRVFQDRRELLEVFFRYKYPNERDTRAAMLSRLPSFEEVDETCRAVLLEGFVHLTTRAELESDLALIRERLKARVVFVCHIDVTDMAGKVIESRARLCNWMREICSQNAYELFEPAPLALSYGRTQALAEEGRDANHYTREFKPVLGSEMYDTFLAPLRPAQEATAVLNPIAALEHLPTEAPAPRAPATEVSGELRTVLTEAKSRIAKGDMDEAEILLRAAAIDHAGSGEVYTLLGTVAYHRGDSTGALADLRHAMQIDPTAVEPKILLVKIAQRLGRFDEACAQALDLVATVPNDHKALTAAAKALTKAKRFSQAAGVWRRVSMLREHQAAALTEAARCELKGRNYDDAVKLADAALAREPDEIGALTIKVEALQRSKRLAELGAVAMRIATVDPGAALAVVPSLIASSHHEDAAAVIAAVREHGHQGAVDAMMQAGLIRSLRDRARRATERQDSLAASSAWRAVELLDPANKNAVSGIRKLLKPVVTEVRRRSNEGDWQGAIAECRRGLSFDPNNAKLTYELARLSEKVEAWDVAAKSWEAVAQVTVPPQVPLLRAARAAGRADRPEEALRLYASLDAVALAEVASRAASLARKVVKAMRDDLAEGRLDEAVRKARLVQLIDAESTPAKSLLRKAISAYRRLIKAAVEDKDIQRQESLSLKLLELDSSRTDALRALVRVYGNARRWRECIEVLERLTLIEPMVPQHWRKFASICRSARLYDQGVVAALRASELEPGNTASLDLLSDMLNRQAMTQHSKAG